MQSARMAQSLSKAQPHTPNKPRGAVQEGSTDPLAEFPSLDHGCVKPRHWLKVGLLSLGRDGTSYGHRGRERCACICN